jgi:hypothetical protein
VGNKEIPAGGLIGAAVAMIGGVIKMMMYYMGIEWGGELYGPCCLLYPMLGGSLGLVGAMAAHKVWESRISIYVGGFLGGLLPTLFFYPYIGWCGQY